MKPVWDLPLQHHGIEMQLADNQIVRIRPIRPSDRPGLLLAFERFSTESRYLRFFGGLPHLPESVVDSLSNVDHQQQLAWAVFDPAEPSQVGDGSGLAIASARLFIDEVNPKEAEATLAVVDAYQNKGIGRFLVDLLISTGLGFGLDVLRFEVLAENRGMRRLLGSIGAKGVRHVDDPAVIVYRLEISELPDGNQIAGALYELLRRTSEE